MAEEAREAVWAILNDPDSYEYEGLGWGAVAALRELFDIPEPKGAWLTRPMDPMPKEADRG